MNIIDKWDWIRDFILFTIIGGAGALFGIHFISNGSALGKIIASFFVTAVSIVSLIFMVIEATNSRKLNK